MKTMVFCALVILIPAIALCQSAVEIRYISAADHTEQPARFHAPTTREAVPLVVILHTWSGDYRQQAHEAIERWCVEQGWAYIHPDFRGPNNRPEATGSALVVGDILSAVAYAQRETVIDASAIFLIGTSGGGYTALVIAGKHPELWAGVSVWAPISDLRAWHRECKAADRRYYKDIEASCGGAPGDSPTVDREYRERSPLTYLANAKGLNLHINTGIHDGHTGSVPISHALYAFNEIAMDKDKITEKDILYMVEHAAAPEHLMEPIADPTFGDKRPLFRRVSGNAVVTLFDGGHELIPEAATAWFETLYEKIRTDTFSYR